MLHQLRMHIVFLYADPLQPVQERLAIVQHHMHNNARQERKRKQIRHRICSRQIQRRVLAVRRVVTSPRT
jgi:hypothetical protein